MMTRVSVGAIAAVATGLLACWSALAAEKPAVRLQGGTRFNLELAHHLTSSQTAAGSPVFFRVVNDVVARGAVLIRRGTVVEGRMQATGDRRMLGTSGTVNFGVRYVQAVDGQNIRVIATVAREGRARDGAVVGWVIMWGIFGLMTKGVDAYGLRGAQLEAEVLSDRLIVPADRPADPGAAASVVNSVTAIGHRFGGEKNRPVNFSLERAPKPAPLVFALPGGLAVESATLLSVNGAAVPEPIRAVSTADASLQFSAWDVIKYCDDGANKLRFRGLRPGNEPLDIDYELPVRLQRKVTSK